MVKHVVSQMGIGNLFSEESYLIEDDFEKGDPAFEVQVHKIRIFPNLVRQILRENYRLKRRIEELENGQKES